MFQQMKTGEAQEDKLNIKKKLKGKTAHERERLAEIEQVNEADNIS